MKIFVVHGQPILLIKGENSNSFGLNRDRDPDNGWLQLRYTNLKNEKVKKVKLTKELKITLLEDLAYAFGNDTKKFREKLIEFKLI